MSGLVGVWHLDGRAADPATVTALAATIAHRGPDHFGLWSDGPVGLACHLLRVTPESATECQPAVGREGDVLLFDGRLDDRDDLLASLSDPPPRDAADSAIVLAAWREWGSAFLGRLRGDFALALFDATAQRLLLARDPIGCRPLYYWNDGTTIVFASEIKAVAAHPDVTAKPNADLLADFVLLDLLPYDDEGCTLFEGIHAVRPGWLVQVDPHDARSQRFWDFDPRARVRYGSYAAYAERLRELLILAVKRRLRSRRPIAVAVSGGLDSSIVLCIADDLRRRGDAGISLLPMSYTPVDDPSCEEHLFLSLIESSRELQVQRIAAGAPGGLEEIANGAWHAEWPRIDEGWFAQRPMLAAARAQGAGSLLTGLWSDQFLFATGYLVDLFRSLAWRDVASHLAEYPRWFVDAESGYFKRRFRRELITGLIPHTMRRWLRPLRRRAATSPTPTFVAPEWAARLDRRRPSHARPRCATVHARNMYDAVRSQAHRLQFEADEKLTASYALESASPFLDRDVIAFLMSIPGDVQTRGGVPRALLRDAMRGIVPDAILNRRWRDEGRVAASRGDVRLTADAFPTIDLSLCAALGFVSEAHGVGANSLDFIGLEVWSRVFFSGKLSPPQLG